MFHRRTLGFGFCGTLARQASQVVPVHDQEQDGEVVKLKLAKHRNGPTGEIELWFKKKQTRFVSYASERYAEAQ